MVRAVRFRALCRRTGPHLWHAGRAVTHAVAEGRRRAEGVVLRAAQGSNRRYQVNRGEISGAGKFHDPLGGRTLAQRIQGSAALVRQGRHAGVQVSRYAEIATGALAPASCSTMSAPFSPIIRAAALALPETTVGMIEASMTRRCSKPRTRRRSSTTAFGSEPMRQVEVG